MQDSIFDIVREAEDNYIHGNTQMSEYVNFDMHNTLETIDAYLNSKHISGSEDALGRDKPFFNIVTAATNIWYRATDIDRKDLKFIPTNSSSVLLAFVANVMLQNWMNDNRFGQFLNQWGRTLARYGSAVLKFVEVKGELIPSVVPWNRLIVDPIDFEALPRIEKFYKTPAQLRKMKHYDQDMVEALITSVQARETLDGQQKDNQSKFIELYEVHGELPESFLTDKEPEDPKKIVYTQQMHVISYVRGAKNAEFDDFTLYRGKEAKDPYMITHLIEEDGRTLSIGAVEYLFDAQWMQNHTVKNMKDLLDLTSKLVFQSADGSFVGKNVITSIENGDIFTHEDNKPLSQINTSKGDVTALQNFSGMWTSLAQEITSTPDALRGVTMPSGTPYSLGAFLGAQANSLFEIMTENKGLSLEDILRIHVIPNLRKKLKNKDEVVAILDGAGIQEIDALYVPRAAVKKYNKEAKQALLRGEVPAPFNKDVAEAGIKDQLGNTGNKRFFKPDELDQKQWDEIFSDFEWDSIRVEVTNENTDKQAVLTTLSTVLQTIASNPAILQDPNAKVVFNSILAETGRISPLQIATAQAAPQPTASPPGGAEALSALTAPTNGTGTS